METQTQVRRAWAFGWSVVIVSVLSSLLVVLKETSEATMALMKAASGHHWITHSIIVLVLFVVIGLALGFVDTKHGGNGALNGIAIAIVASTVIGGLILAGFNLLH